MWCFMLNSSPGPQMFFIVKSKAWSPLNDSSGNFSLVLLLHSCVLHLDTSKKPRNLESAGVRDRLCILSSSLDTAPVKNILHTAVLGSTVSD